MNVPQVASSIKFLADSSSKRGFHYLDHCIVLMSIKGIQSLCLCLFFLCAKHNNIVIFWTFKNKVFFVSENFALCFKTHSAVKSYYVLLYGFSIHNNFWNTIYTVHTFLMHEAHTSSLVCLMLHCVHFLWLFLW